MNKWLVDARGALVMIVAVKYMPVKHLLFWAGLLKGTIVKTSDVLFQKIKEELIWGLPKRIKYFPGSALAVIHA